MCLVAFAIDQHPKYRFILAANRDEFRKRPSRQAAFWDEHPNLLGGRDLKELGTWLGITKSGKIGFLTNYREMGSIKENAPTRGHLVSDYLINEESATTYVEGLGSAQQYNGFNLLVGDSKQLIWFSNYGERQAVNGSGIHVISNAHLDTPWPKTEKLKQEIENLVNRDIGKSDDQQALMIEGLFKALRNETKAADENLPETGIGLDWERILSPPFINTPEYGTVCSTVILIDQHDQVYFQERSFDKLGDLTSSVDFQFGISE